MPSITRAQAYRDREFGITIERVPKDATLCRVPNNEHDHGPVLLLGSSNQTRCYDGAHSRRIDVFASYKTDEDRTLTGAFKSACAGFPAVETCGPAPTDLGVRGLKSMAGVVKYPDGSVDVIVVAQAGKPDPKFDPSGPYVNFQLNLHTAPAHLAADLRVFREILQTVRLFPPPVRVQSGSAKE